MSETVLVIGESGTGKSSSIRNLNPVETFIINVLDKTLPFKNSRKIYVQKEGGNYFSTDKAEKIIDIAKHISMKRPEIKNLVIDDYQYIMANEFMKRADEKGYGKFSEIGQKGWSVVNEISKLRSDLDCFVLSHNEIGDDGRSRCKVIGKMMTNHITLEGMFSIILHTVIKDGKYKFITNGDDTKTAKTPMGMFNELFIDNDLSFVKQKMSEYLNEDIPQ